jgi:hypothetical protein
MLKPKQPCGEPGCFSLREYSLVCRTTLSSLETGTSTLIGVAIPTITKCAASSRSRARRMHPVVCTYRLNEGPAISEGYQSGGSYLIQEFPDSRPSEAGMWTSGRPAVCVISYSFKRL